MFMHDALLYVVMFISLLHVLLELEIYTNNQIDLFYLNFGAIKY